jgi:hypothetical protein
MKTSQKLMLLVALAVSLNASQVFAKSSGAPSGGANHQSEVKTSGTSAARPSGSGGQSKFRPANCPLHKCAGQPGYTQPTCRGGHMGPNGVMVECK